MAGSAPTASAFGGPRVARLQAYDAAGAYAFGCSTAAQRATELRQQARELGYANHFEASRIAIPWRPQLEDGSGARLNPRPTGPA